MTQSSRRERSGAKFAGADISYSLLAIPCLLPAYFHLPTSYLLLPTSYFLFPISYFLAGLMEEAGDEGVVEGELDGFLAVGEGAAEGGVGL